LFIEIGLEHLVHLPTTIFADNKTANQWCHEDKVTNGNGWILQCYHYVKEMEANGENFVAVEYVNSKLNLADVFTKGVSKEVLDALGPYLWGQQPIHSLLSDIERQDQLYGKQKAP
jgi:hypothetical protein